MTRGTLFRRSPRFIGAADPHCGVGGFVVVVIADIRLTSPPNRREAGRPGERNSFARVEVLIDSLDQAFVAAWHTSEFWHPPAADATVPWLREKRNWIPLYVALLAWLLWVWRWRGLALAAAAGACVGLADYLSAGVIKPLVGRLRPCNTDGVREALDLLTGCGPGLSFPSAHATNHFALATVLAVTCFAGRPYTKWAAFLWAASIALAQVYVGRHYVSDILAGALLGATLGWSFGYAFTRLVGLSKPDAGPAVSNAAKL